MEVTPYSGYEGEIITLSCIGNTIPLKATTQLVPNLSIEWVGPTGTILTNESNITVSPRHQSLHGVVRTLTITGTNYSNTGVYSCVVTPNVTHLSFVYEDYHFALKSKTWHCRATSSENYVSFSREHNFIYVPTRSV